MRSDRQPNSKAQEISPDAAASILGMSRALVVHRMDVGDLPFRYVGRHRRAKLKDVLALKDKLDAQRAALEELTEEMDSLMRVQEADRERAFRDMVAENQARGLYDEPKLSELKVTRQPGRAKVRLDPPEE